MPVNIKFIGTSHDWKFMNLKSGDDFSDLVGVPVILFETETIWRLSTFGSHCFSVLHTTNRISAVHWKTNAFGIH